MTYSTHCSLSIENVIYTGKEAMGQNVNIEKSI